MVNGDVLIRYQKHSAGDIYAGDIGSLYNLMFVFTSCAQGNEIQLYTMLWA